MIPLQSYKKVPRSYVGTFFYTFYSMPAAGDHLEGVVKRAEHGAQVFARAFPEPGEVQDEAVSFVPATARESIARGVICKL